MNNFLSYLGHLFRIIKTVIIKRNLPGHSFYRYINVISFCEADVGNVSGGRFESGNNVSCHWNCQIHIKYGKWLKKSSENKDINMDTKSYVLKLQHQYVLQRLGKYYFFITLFVHRCYKVDSVLCACRRSFILIHSFEWFWNTLNSVS